MTSSRHYPFPEDDDELRDPFADDPLVEVDPFGDTTVGSPGPATDVFDHPAPEPAATGDGAGRLAGVRARLGRGLGARPASTQHQNPAGGATPARPAKVTTYLPLVVVLIGGVLAAIMLYLGLVEITPISTDPLGNALVFFAIGTAGLLLCAVALIGAIRGVVVGRPRYRPVLAIVTAVVFVPLLVLGAGNLGLNDAKREFQDSAATDLGRTLARVLTLLENEGVDIGPLEEFTD